MENYELFQSQLANPVCNNYVDRSTRRENEWFIPCHMTIHICGHFKKHLNGATIDYATYTHPAL